MNIIFLIALFFISACSTSSDGEEHGWMPGSYVAERDGTHIDLSLHSLDGVDDILQADIMIHHTNGSGPSFEVQNASVENDKGILHFDWTDGFENKGNATIEKVLDKEDSVRLKLEVTDIENERDMMFIDDYILTKVSEKSNDNYHEIEKDTE